MVDSWRQFNRLFDEAFGIRNPGAIGGRPAQWIPPADVSEDERQFTLTLELPGLKAEEVSLALEGNQLEISGEKRFEQESGNAPQSRRIERSRRSFRRVFTLPDSVDVDGIEASIADGILTVSLPKTERAKPRSIQVRSAGRKEVGSGGNGANERNAERHEPEPVEVRR
jgi:HSP20 family protein